MAIANQQPKAPTNERKEKEKKDTIVQGLKKEQKNNYSKKTKTL